MSLEKTVLFLTKNFHKYNEANEILSEYDIHLKHLTFDKLELQSNSIEDVSKFSAIQAYKQLKHPLIVEDAGLFIHSLNGFPGSYSSYVFHTIGCNGLLQLMKIDIDRSAEFRSVVTYVDFREGVRCFNGIVHGYLSFEKKGENGFGFDPIFIPKSEKSTFAEVSSARKNKISHRGKSLRLFAEWIVN
jgi:XTP/dITP diphosphohydrolase